MMLQLKLNRKVKMDDIILCNFDIENNAERFDRPRKN